MKQYIILICTVTLVIIFHILQAKYLQNTSRYVMTDLNDIEIAIERKDFDSARLSAEELQSTWMNIKSGWDSFGEHDDVGEIGNSVENLRVCIEQMEATDSLIYISDIRHLLKHVIESEQLRIHNIL